MRQTLKSLLIILMLVSFHARAQTRQVDLLITGGTVVTMNSTYEIIENGALAIEGSKIIEVGISDVLTKRFTGRQTISAEGKVIVPGLINTHTHAPMSLFRGIADDLELHEWLNNYIFVGEAKNVDAEFVRVGTQLSLAEMIRGGTTTYCDMYYFENEIAEETARAGMRAVLGETVIDFKVPDNNTPEDALKYVENFARRWKGHPLITPAIAPHAPYTVDETVLKKVRTLATSLEIPVLIHLAETKTEVETIQKKKGNTPIGYLNAIDFLKDDVIAAHVVHATDTDLDIIKKQNVGVAHNPQSNMKLASGVAPVPVMLKKDIFIGLGTDGAASNNDLNLWEEIDMVAKLHKVFTLDPKAVNAREAFTMATIGGAKALHLSDSIGSLEAGKLADVVMIDFDKPHLTPIYDYYSHLVYATKASDVNTVVINGKLVMQDKKLLTLDETSIIRKSMKYRDQIRKSLTSTEGK